MSRFARKFTCFMSAALISKQKVLIDHYGYDRQEQQQSVIPVIRNSQPDKPHVVILGSGWASVSIIKNLSKEYNVTVISPTNYFLFTPLLPSSTVGSTHINSLTEPVRNILRRNGWKFDTLEQGYIEAAAVDVQFYCPNTNPDGSNRVLCQTKEGSKFYVEYDKLIIAVGSRSITFGVKGVDKYCHQLKTVHDATLIRQKILLNFEQAAQPQLSEDERKRLLTFVACGGGPTACEAISSINDFIVEDLVKYYPQELIKLCKLVIIQSQDHILNTYDAKISAYAQKKFARDGIEVLLNSRVSSVDDGMLTYTEKVKGGQEKQVQIPFGLCLWTTGVGMQPFAEKLADKLDAQSHSRALVVDERLRLKGVFQGSTSIESDYSHGNIFCVGDCATVDLPLLINKIMDMFQRADKDHSNSLSYEEFRRCAIEMKLKYPQTGVFLSKLNQLFYKYDEDRSGNLEYNEFKKMVTDISQKLKPYPATAQVAQQQGTYVARYLNWQLDHQTEPVEEDFEDDPRAIAVTQRLNAPTIIDDDGSVVPIYYYPAFNYHHLGSLAYLGNDTAVLDLSHGLTLGATDKGGIISRLTTLYLWRSVYLSEVVSIRQRVRLASDWLMAFLFGREIARFG